MQKRQQGMTFIGMVLLLTVFGFIAYGVIQMVPVYLENMKVVKVLNQVKDELDGQNANLTDIRKSLEKRIDIEELRDIDWRQDFDIVRTAGGYSIAAIYERQRPLVSNLYLLAEFDYEVQVNR